MRSIACVIALAACAGPAVADELPHRKPGLWEIVSQPSNPKLHPMTQRLCLDRDTDALLARFGVQTGQQACSTLDIKVSGSRATIHAVCSLGSSTLTSDAVTTYSGDSSYRTEVHGKFAPAFAGTTDTHTVQDGKWTGACPADMKPGDLVTMASRPGGHEVRMNLRTMLKAQP
jgi:hypothetical protein